MMINQRILKIISVTFVVIAVLVWLLGIRGIVTTDWALKSIYTCTVIWITILIISSMDWILSLWNVTSKVSFLWSILKTVALLGTFTLSILAVLSIRDMLPTDVQWKAYSSVLLIFMWAVIWWIIEKRFANPIITPEIVEPINNNIPPIQETTPIS